MAEEVVDAPAIDYNYVGDDSLKNKRQNKIKKILIPNIKLINGYILVLVVVFIVAAGNFPLSSFMSGNLNDAAPIGIPSTFVELSLNGKTTFYESAFLLDILIWSLFAYIINILFNFLSGIKLFKKKSEAEEQPTIFKNQKMNTAVKAAEKIS